MVLTPEQIQQIYQLSQVQRWSCRKVARHLGLGRAAVRKYARRPALVEKPRQRGSQLEPFRAQILEWLASDPGISAEKVRQRLQPLGFKGGRSATGAFLSKLRPRRQAAAFVRIESQPGEQFQVDWAECGRIDYDGQRRRLYAFAMVEAHSRMLYVEFTHSMKLASLARCHLHAFHFFGGICREILYDNMRTVVSQREGRLVSFNLNWLEFARQMGFVPKVCRPCSPWQKGKIERSIGYVKQNFLDGHDPFHDLADANGQGRHWLVQTANQRLHRETRERPAERLQPQALTPLPAAYPDYRDTVSALAGKDLRLHFDGNRYCVPARLAGTQLTVRADSHTVSIYDKTQEVVSYPRSWRRGQTLGAERFEKELLDQRPRAQPSSQADRLTQLLGPLAQDYLRGLAAAGFPLARHTAQLLDLVRRYEVEAVRRAMERALALKAWGADYVANILHQQASPRTEQPPVLLRDPRLAQLLPDPVSLLEYDAFIFNHQDKESE